MTQVMSISAAAAPPHIAPLIEVNDLAVSFGGGIGDRRTRAVNGVTFSVFPRQTLAIVGESGCGKSVTALAIMRLIDSPGIVDGGTVMFGGRDLLKMRPKEMLSVRGREIAMIFQEPMTSLNPVFTIGDQIIEAILLHQDVGKNEAKQRAIAALTEVGISNAHDRLRSYPHEFSGGMRQRVMIAMALACRPTLLLADEPTTALDVTIQARILQLLRRLQADRGMGMMLITHDLGLVAQHADVVCVMYAGRVMEYASVQNLLARPLHPYTRGLLKCKPSLHERVGRLTTVAEVVNDPQQFNQLGIGGGSLRPWWSRGDPAASSADQPCMVCQVEPEHWVACESSHVAEYLCASKPSIASCRTDQLDSR